MERPQLEVKNLRFSCEGREILNIGYFDLKKGECLVLFGPNGSGKSTFLRIISFLQQADSGEIYYQGQKAGKKNRLELSRKVVYLLQKPVFFKGTVKDNLLMGLKFRKIDDHQQKQRLEKISELFALDSLLKRSPLELSGGERQRVHLARAFILEPEFLFLDEPFNGLDVQFWEEIIADFYRIRKTTEVTTILVTHLRQEAAFLADRLAVMLRGKITQTGSLEEVLSSPATPEISRLMGQETLVDGVVEKSENGFLVISAHDQTVYAFGHQKEGERVVLTFRPEEVILALDKPATSVRNWFCGQVYELRPFDRMILVSINCGFKLKAYVSRSSVDELQLAPGRQVWAGIKASALTTRPGRQGEERKPGE